MKWLRAKLISFCGIPPRRKYLFSKVIWLSIFRGILFYIGSPLAFSEKILKKFPNAEVSQTQLKEVKDIAFAIELAAKYIPWPNLCRHQSWQAIYLLNEKQIPYTYQVGVNRENKDEGHSWIIVDDEFICGSCQITEYVLIKQEY